MIQSLQKENVHSNYFSVRQKNSIRPSYDLRNDVPHLVGDLSDSSIERWKMERWKIYVVRTDDIFETGPD